MFGGNDRLHCLLLSSSCLLKQAQSVRRQSIWEDPIKFKTKDNDVCNMIITGQGDFTRLRLSCQGSKRSYWCEYLGTPQTCRTYSKNPRHYFVQMMWGLRKLHNACQGPRQIKPHMCRSAGDDAQMVLSSASFSRPWTEGGSSRPGRPARPPAPTRPDSPRKPVRVPPRVRTTQRSRTQPTTPPVETNAKRMARQYCWRSLQGICGYVIGLFRN
uniref:Fibroblast growth factor binding protein 2a n=1 Tax=Sparus aurata TaxID=8175 RepID=A0A671W686_SPAAU